LRPVIHYCIHQKIEKVYSSELFGASSSSPTFGLLLWE
jgi:hypothetical protein